MMIGRALPRISCVLVTTGRVSHVKNAVDCYLRQSYMNRELVVISQGDKPANQAIESYLKQLDRGDILFLEAPQNLCLGAMRNTSVEAAQGEIICQWDDDDLYHPDRLMTQYYALRCDSRNVAAIYSDFLKYFKPTGELYWCDWSGEPLPTHKFLCGSAMFYKRVFHDYHVFYPESGPQSHVEEDLKVVEKLLWKGQIAPVFAGHQYLYVYHGGNTYDLNHHLLTLNTSWGKQVLGVRELLQRRPLIEAALEQAKLPDSVRVRSKDEFAFTYSPPSPIL